MGIVQTANNDLIQKSILEIHSQVDEPLAKLINGESVEVLLNPFVQFDELAQDEKTFWGLLLFAGYLTSELSRLGEDIDKFCRLRIPNEEILRLFKRYTETWFKEHLGTQHSAYLIEGLLTGDVETWVEAAHYYSAIHCRIVGVRSFIEHAILPRLPFK